MIKVFVQKTMAQAVVDTPLTSGSKGLTVEFVFSEDWNGLEKTAVFETSSFYKETEQLTGETIEVPEDVMAWANETLYVGVYGTSQNGATVIPTVYADCGKIQKGANDSEGGRPLIPAQSDILQNQIDSLGDRVAWLEETGGGGGGAGIFLDPTLTQSGKAADAKAVGDALEQKQDAGNYLTDHNTFVGDVNTSSAAFYEAFSARKPCFLLRSDAGSGMVMWVAHDCTSRVARFYNVTPDGTVRYATLEGLVFSYESAAGGSGNVFIGDANTTVAEFYEADNAGKVCFLKRAYGPSGTVTWVSYNCTQYSAFFYHVTNGGVVLYASLSEDGTWRTNKAFSDVVKSINGITPDPSGKVTLPIPTTLPNPHKLTFSGAVSAEYDGSEAVEVVIPQGGGGSSGAGGASEEVWELLADVTLEEEVKTFEQAWAGNPMKKVMINISTLAHTQNANYMPTTVFTTDDANKNLCVMRVYPTPLPKTSAENVTYIVEAFKLGEDAVLRFTEHNKGVTPISNQMSFVGAVNSFATYGNGLYQDAVIDQITGISVQTYETFAIGTHYTIWGVAK